MASGNLLTNKFYGVKIQIFRQSCGRSPSVRLGVRKVRASQGRMPDNVRWR